MKITQKYAKHVTYTLQGSDILRLLNLPEGAKDVQGTVEIPWRDSGIMDLDEDAVIRVTFTLEGE